MARKKRASDHSTGVDVGETSADSLSETAEPQSPPVELPAQIGTEFNGVMDQLAPDEDDPFAGIVQGEEAAQELSASATGSADSELDEQEEEDPFAGVGEAAEDGPAVTAGEASVETASSSPKVQPQHPDSLDQDDDTLHAPKAELLGDEDDPFAGIGQADEHPTESNPHSPSELAMGAGELDIEDDKDYSDLLAEFGDDESPVDNEDQLTDLPESVPAAAQSVSASQLAESLFDTDHSDFDNILASSSNELGAGSPGTVTPPELESPAPELSIEMTPPASEHMGYPGDMSMQSLLSETSDWLGDTTMDDSFVMRQDEQDGARAGPQEVLEDQEVDVPEGWIDDNGEFHYYTLEESAAVRASLLAEKPEKAAQGASRSALVVETPPPFPSENAARRTPQPDQRAQFALPAVPSPYSPPNFSRHSSSSRVTTQASSSTLATPGLDPYSAQQPAYNAYAPPAPGPSSAPYDPYAPPPQPYPYLNTPPSRTSLDLSPRKSGPSQAKPTRPEPQRVASNAYDPPFLRPQKSFIRPTSAAPSVTPAFTPPLPSITPVQVAAAAAPPPGPPRRVPSVPPSSYPISGASSHAKPPAPTYEPESSRRSRDAYREDPYAAQAMPPGPPARPPSRPESQTSVRQSKVPNAFDPPLRPPSVSRATSRQPYAPPPPPPSQPPPSAYSAFSPSPSSLPLPPSRPGSAAPPRRASPFFEPPPKRTPAAAPARLPPLRSPNELESEAPESGVPRDAGWPHLSGEEEDDDEQPISTGARLPMRPPAQIYEPAPNSSWGNHEENLADGNSHLNGFDAVAREESPGQAVSRGSGGPPVFAAAPARDTYRRDPRDQSEGSRPRLDYDEDAAGGSRHLNGFDAVAEDSYDGRHPAPPDFASQASRPDVHIQAPETYSAPSTSYDPYAPSNRQDPYAPTNPASAPPIAPPGRSHTPPRDTRPVPRASPAKSRPALPAFAHPAQDPYAPSAASLQAGPSAYQPSAYQPSANQPESIPTTKSTSYAPASYTPAMPVAAAADLYAPQRTISPAHEQAGSHQDNNYFGAMHLDTSYVPQQVLEQRPLSEDPLGRCTAAAKNIPLAVFGFGGSLVTAFPGTAEDTAALGHSRTPSYGYASGRGQIHIRPLSSVLEVNSFKSDTTPFPGPLILDPSTPKGAAGDKKKKESVLAYLDARAEEIEKGLPYLKSSASGTRTEEEGKLLLVRLLSALVIGEGKFGGSPQADEAMRKALANPSSAQPLHSPMATHVNAPLYPTASSSASKSVAASTSQLSTLSDMLVAGDKRDAVDYASRHGLWSHALLVASSLGPEVWKETVSHFVKEELAAGSAGLKASYTLFAGSDPSIVDDLFSAAGVSDDPAKDSWREVIASVVFNGRPGDLAHLDDLGGRYMSRGLHNAAYACFLLSPSSPFADPTPAASDRPIAMVQNARSEDAVLFAEIAEYARGLIVVPKGQEVGASGLPALLPYKLQRAWQAAEEGEVELAKRYCNAIEAALKATKTGPALLAPHYLSSLEDLLERLTGSPSIDPAKGLSARKQTAKPGFDKLGSWIEGRLTKFIAGEDDSSSATTSKPAPTAKAASSSGGAVGPFSHFSTISPAQSSDVSRNGSVPDFTGKNGLLAPSDGKTSGPLSFGMPSPHNELPPSNSSYGGYSAWGSNSAEGAEAEGGAEDNDVTPHADDVGELLNPMAALSFGGPSFAPESRAASKKADRVEDEDEDDLGFGNAGLSRGRTPRPADADASDGATSAKPGDKKAVEPTNKDAAKATDDSPSKQDAAAKAGWFKGWWGKKEGEGSGPVRAKLGDENAMVFDKELKRWVVKGQKPEAAPAAPPPPPRAQTASPSKANRAPPSGPPGPSGFNTMPRSVSSSAAFNGESADLPPSGPKRTPAPPRSGLSESVTADQVPPAAAALSMPAGPPPKPSLQGNGPPPPAPNQRPGATGPPISRPGSNAPSIDDLLSRPPSKRPASAAAKKGARNRYVDVFQQPAADS